MLYNWILLFFAAGGFSKAMSCHENWKSWSPEELENQVSPSRWNPKKDKDAVIQEYINVSLEGTKVARNTVPHQLDVSYGMNDAQKYDIYGTDLANNSPIFLWIHGGYWQEGSKEISGHMTPITHYLGIRSVIIGYTLAPNATLKEIESEITLAINDVASKYPESKLFVGGHSAGGQLSSMLLHKPWGLGHVAQQNLAGLILVSGVYNLQPLVPTYVNNPLKLTMEGAESSSPLCIGTLIPAIRSKSSTLRVLLTVGQYDSPWFRNQTQEYGSFLKKHFPLTEIQEIVGEDHFTIVQNMMHENNWFRQFMATLLK